MKLPCEWRSISKCNSIESETNCNPARAIWDLKEIKYSAERSVKEAAVSMVVREGHLGAV